MATVAFIGLGNMGGNMCRHLIAAGHQLRVFARREDAMTPYVELGAVATISPADAANGADFVFTNVTATADVESVLLGASGVIETAAPGTIICDFSTIDATATRAIAAQLAEREIGFMDCPVSGGTKAAEAGTLTIMVGGTDEHMARARPLLEKLGTNIFRMGNVGDGQVTKACNQIVQVVAIQGIAEAMLYAEVNDVDLHKVVEALMSGFAGSKMLGLMGPKMAARDFAAGIEARLHHKDFGLVADAAAKQHLPMPATALVHQQLSKLMEAGWGKMDTCNLLRVLEKDMTS
ncbi:6-phosphogluconate dehydrogenase [Betaproteobacteria bacterium UKL13-2]|jgi:3-hydroxyisobutyrate dehydrogenase-like beta-hydroxyacid dehydrogenase|nr:6-phosphogluconate dehydrogenase [Betaproteobacteria bacterium UKL13-2]HCG54514.1 2-hydroxy-3-oxopropionate reductase [Betaproteobacteria bacterium]